MPLARAAGGVFDTHPVTPGLRLIGGLGPMVWIPGTWYSPYGRDCYICYLGAPRFESQTTVTNFIRGVRCRGLRSDPFVHVGLIFKHFISCLFTLNHVISLVFHLFQLFLTFSDVFSCFLIVFFPTFSLWINITGKKQQPSNLSLLYRRFNPVWLSKGTHPW